MKNSFEIIQPPKKLASGFLEFAKTVQQACIEKDAKLSEEELVEITNNSFSGKTRTNFLFWIGDINKFIKTTNIILSDLHDLKENKATLKGDPVIRSEFLFQSFFGEFFKAREVAKLYLKFFKNVDLLSNSTKEQYINFYITAFDWVYELRNKFIHLGMEMKDYDVNFDIELFNEFSKEDKERFINLLNEENTRENTVEFQSAIYIKIIISIMEKYIEFQNIINDTLADLILLFEKHNLHITVTKYDN